MEDLRREMERKSIGRKQTLVSLMWSPLVLRLSLASEPPFSSVPHCCLLLSCLRESPTSWSQAWSPFPLLQNDSLQLCWPLTFVPGPCRSLEGWILLLASLPRFSKRPASSSCCLLSGCASPLEMISFGDIGFWLSSLQHLLSF